MQYCDTCDYFDENMDILESRHVYQRIGLKTPPFRAA